MNGNTNEENYNFVISRQISQKFEFYFIALTFTILGLSIQTASFTNINSQCFMEIIGWLCLAFSGLAGLSRLEWLPVAYRHYGSLQQEKNSLNVFNQGLQGRTILKGNQEEWSIEELKDTQGNLTTRITEREKVIKRLDRSTVIKYKIHKWGFVIGVFCIIFSRAIIGLYIYK